MARHGVQGRAVLIDLEAHFGAHEGEEPATTERWTSCRRRRSTRRTARSVAPAATDAQAVLHLARIRGRPHTSGGAGPMSVPPDRWPHKLRSAPWWPDADRPFR